MLESTNSKIIPKVAKKQHLSLDAKCVNIDPKKVRYNGPVKAVILDWSGTLLDAGVLAPAVVFVDVFKKFGINITMLEARIPMGLRKDLHIGALLKLESVRIQWFVKYGSYPDENTQNIMFKEFVPMQLSCLHQYSTIIPGADTTVQYLRKNGIKTGLTTGFTKEMSDVLREEAKKQGVDLDTTVAGDEVVHGARPSPFMVYKNLDNLGIYPIQAVVKVDDTVTGVGEGLNAGCWTVGLCRWSNYTNYDSLEQMNTASQQEIEQRSKEARKILKNSGAHYIIEDISELPEVIECINTNLSQDVSPTDI